MRISGAPRSPSPTLTAPGSFLGASVLSSFPIATLHRTGYRARDEGKSPRTSRPRTQPHVPGAGAGQGRGGAGSGRRMEDSRRSHWKGGRGPCGRNPWAPDGPSPFRPRPIGPKSRRSSAGIFPAPSASSPQRAAEIRIIRSRRSARPGSRGTGKGRATDLTPWGTRQRSGARRPGSGERVARARDPRFRGIRGSYLLPVGLGTGRESSQGWPGFDLAGASVPIGPRIGSATPAGRWRVGPGPCRGKLWPGRADPSTRSVRAGEPSG